MIFTAISFSAKNYCCLRGELKLCGVIQYTLQADADSIYILRQGNPVKKIPDENRRYRKRRKIRSNLTIVKNRKCRNIRDFY